MIAPFPAADYIESPYEFTAVTRAQTLAPQYKLYGADLSVVTGIAHYVASVIAATEPSQFVKSRAKFISSLIRM